MMSTPMHTLGCHLLLSTLLVIAQGEKQVHPNIIILLADDMGYGDLSCHGHPTISTPHIDAMARSGMRFTQMYAAHICTPSRAQLLTGRLAVRSGMAGPWQGGVLSEDAVGGLPATETTIADALKSAGYSTLAVGKWHLGQQKQFLPTSKGFDEYYGIPYSVDQGDSAWAKGFSATQVPLPLLHNLAIVEQPVNLNTLEKRYVEKVDKFIEDNVNSKTKFFVYLAFNHVHTPDFVNMDHCNKSDRGRFGDAVEELDEHVGKVFESIAKHGVDDSTVVFFASDNGPWMTQELSGGSPGMFFEGKTTTWEGGIRVPFIVRWPGQVPEASTSAAMVALYDIFSTAVKLSGASLPKDLVIDGEDLSGVMLRKEKGPHKCLFHYKGMNGPDAEKEPGLWAMRCGAYKAHFVTSCSVMQWWGDWRCSNTASGGDSNFLATAPSLFQACSEERPGEECAVMLGTPPHIRDPPLIFNVNQDPGELYPLRVSTPEYQAALKEIMDEKKKHEATVEKVDNQILKGTDPSLRLCCEVDQFDKQKSAVVAATTAAPAMMMGNGDKREDGQGGDKNHQHGQGGNGDNNQHNQGGDHQHNQGGDHQHNQGGDHQHNGQGGNGDHGQNNQGGNGEHHHNNEGNYGDHHQNNEGNHGDHQNNNHQGDNGNHHNNNQGGNGGRNSFIETSQDPNASAHKVSKTMVMVLQDHPTVIQDGNEKNGNGGNGHGGNGNGGGGNNQMNGNGNGGDGNSQMNGNDGNNQNHGNGNGGDGNNQNNGNSGGNGNDQGNANNNQGQNGNRDWTATQSTNSNPSRIMEDDAYAPQTLIDKVDTKTCVCNPGNLIPREGLCEPVYMDSTPDQSMGRIFVSDGAEF